VGTESDGGEVVKLTWGEEGEGREGEEKGLYDGPLPRARGVSDLGGCNIGWCRRRGPGTLQR